MDSNLSGITALCEALPGTKTTNLVIADCGLKPRAKVDRACAEDTKRGQGVLSNREGEGAGVLESSHDTSLIHNVMVALFSQTEPSAAPLS